jgi:hypothetical protein
VEQFHRELKQLTGSEKFQCRKARSQHNHITCYYHAWLSLKVYATRLKTTLYQARKNLFTDYLKNELRSPRILAYDGTFSFYLQVKVLMMCLFLIRLIISFVVLRFYRVLRVMT